MFHIYIIYKALPCIEISPMALRALLLSLLLAPLAISQPLETRTGELVVYDFHNPEQTPYFLVEHEVKNATKVTNLVFDAQAIDIDLETVVLFRDVEVTGYPKGSQFIVYDISIINTKLGNRAGPPIMTSITFIVNDLCGKKGVVNSSDLVSQYFNAGSPSPLTGRSATMQGFFDSCSSGKTRFPRDKNIVVDDIRIPCKGPGYDSSQCGMNEVYGWAKEAETQAIAKGFDISLFNHRIIILPNNNACPWAGLGSVNCVGHCYVWAFGARPMYLPVLWHELGHNMGLLHSGTTIAEYGDNSCVMGSAGFTCYNAAQQWRLKWNDAIETIDLRTVLPGRTFRFNIPSVIGTTKSFVRLLQNDITSFFVSFRTSQVGYEFGLLRQFDEKVSVHTTNGSASDAIRTLLLPGNNPLTVGQVLNVTSAGFKVQFESIDNQNNAVVLITIGQGSTNDTMPPPQLPPTTARIPPRPNSIVTLPPLPRPNIAMPPPSPRPNSIANLPPLPRPNVATPRPTPRPKSIANLPPSPHPNVAKSPPPPSNFKVWYVLVASPNLKVGYTAALEKCNKLNRAIVQVLTTVAGVPMQKLITNDLCTVTLLKETIYYKATILIHESFYPSIRNSKLFYREGITLLTTLSETDCNSIFTFPTSFSSNKVLRYKALCN